MGELRWIGFKVDDWSCKFKQSKELMQFFRESFFYLNIPVFEKSKNWVLKIMRHVYFSPPNFLFLHFHKEQPQVEILGERVWTTAFSRRRAAPAPETWLLPRWMQTQRWDAWRQSGTWAQTHRWYREEQDRGWQMEAERLWKQKLRRKWPRRNQSLQENRWRGALAQKQLQGAGERTRTNASSVLV